jgi:predicted nucleotidyltransferase
MQLKDLRQDWIIFKAISGSKAYGLDLPTSDTDIKGVFYLPRHRFYALDYAPQVSDEKNDEVYYELKRFVDLLYKNNPNLLELLSTPEEMILYRHPVLDHLDTGLFLSKKCRDTFAGYAQTQIRKAKGLNKKIHNPVAKERKSILHFCYVLKGQGTEPFLQWLDRNGLVQENCGLVNLPHMKNLYALFYDTSEHLGYRGVMQKETATDVILSSIPKGEQPVNHLYFHQDGYMKYCKDYKEYWDWVAKRNEARYQNTLAHGKNYDAKNMMHTFRLLDMAIEILRDEKVRVRRPNREELLRIRSGHYQYEALIEQANEKLEQVNYWYERSKLPEEPDKEKIEEVLVKMREELYILESGF